MTPGQARIALLSFAAVMLGVAFNIFFLQAKSGGGHLKTAVPPTFKGSAVETSAAGAPEFATAIPSEHQLKIARYAPATGPAQPVGAVRETDRATVKAIQRELSLRGYGPLAEDGTLGLTTRAAILAFEQDQGLAPSGEASERLLRRILFGSVVGADPAPANAGTTRDVPADEVIRSVQGWLSGLGYQPGRVDGRLSQETLQAIRDFEVDRGLVPRGRISADLVVRLSQAAAAAPKR